MPSDPGHPMAVDELFELRRSLEVGLARIDGQLTLHTHRDDQSERELTDLGVRVASLEHTRWPLPAHGAHRPRRADRGGVAGAGAVSG